MTPPMSDDHELSKEYHDAAFNLIVDLRGGLPEKCDFCHEPFTEQRYPVPEEAGDWACSDCVKLWETEE
jgi:hypothetical protein